MQFIPVACYAYIVGENTLGDFVIFTAYALLPTIGTSYVCTFGIDWNVLFIAVPVGLITVAILHCNNLRDIGTDSRAHISTIAMRLGEKTSVWLYCIEILFPYLWISGCVIWGVLPVWTLLAWISVIPAVRNAMTAYGFFKEGSAAISNLDEATAKLQLLFSLSVAAAFVVSGILS